jgi:hypothetical protein
MAASEPVEGCEVMTPEKSGELGVGGWGFMARVRSENKDET